MAYTAIKCAHEHRQILLDVLLERGRQDRLRDAGRFPCTACDLVAGDAITVLLEEAGEVAKAFNDGDHGDARTELVQVAAVALAMIEGIDARNQTSTAQAS